MSPEMVLWYSFETPVNIHSIKAKVDWELNVEFYDSNDNLLQTTNTLKNNEALVNISVSNVSKVALKTTANNTYVYEFDVFGTGSVIETPDEITNLTAQAQATSIVLNWSAVNGATSYIVKRSTAAGGPYTDIASNVAGTTYSDITATVGVTYYYVVVAVNSSSQSGLSNEASATIANNPDPGGIAGDRAILTIYISGGQIKEYDLSAAQLNAFISWYDAKDAGTGPAKYKFTKTWNKGPFKARSEYVIFDKILTFDVDEYDVVNP
jgi:hypothetical protein